jgi:uncharacterized protein
MQRLLGTLAVLLVGCGAGAPSEAVRPDRPTYGDATGVKACATAPTLARPLAVDWRPEDRGDLEVAMKQAIAVVAYDCKSMRVLPDCRVEGQYGYVGIAKKEQLLRLEGADELAANLPFSGGHIAGSMDRGSTLDVALALVGQRVASRPALGRGELHGDCGSATHFVRSASVGAFVLKTGTAAKLTAAADVFTFATSGKSTSSEAVINRDGDLAACTATTPDDLKAAPACSSLVRLELKAIQEGDSQAPIDPFLEQVTANACPSGLTEQAGKCARPEAGTPHLCEYGNREDCRSQCAAGDAPSCTRLGLMYERGDGVTASPNSAIATYQRGCEAKHAPACGRLGLLLFVQPGAPNPPSAALGYLNDACQAGWMQGCQARLEYFRAHPEHANQKDVIAVAERGCNGGNGGSCTTFGWMLASGFIGATAPDKAGPPDLERAVYFYRKGCNAGFGLGCTLLAQAYSKGLGVPKDETRAVEILQLACRSNNMAACSDLSSFYFLGAGGLERSDERGVELLTRACESGHSSSCFILGLRYQKGVSVPKDEGRAMTYLKKACDAGDKTGCDQLTKMSASKAP